MTDCRVRVLGPLEVLVDGEPVTPRGRQAALLALLAAEAGATVPVDRLADALWPENAPRDPVNALQILVSRLRARARRGSDRDQRRAATGSPYRPVRSTRPVRGAGRRGLPGGARAGGRPAGAAERLWRGPAFTPYDDLPGVREPAARLTELRPVRPRARRPGAASSSGRYDDAVADLEALVLAEPLRETAVGGAGHRAGPHRPRRRGARAGGRSQVPLREAGLDPSQRSRSLQQRVLTGDLGPDGEATVTGSPLRLVCRQFLRAPGRDGDVRRGRRRADAGVRARLGVAARRGHHRVRPARSGAGPARRRPARGHLRPLRHRPVARDGSRRSTSRPASPSWWRCWTRSREDRTSSSSASSAASPIAIAAAARDPRIERLVLLGGYADGPGVFATRASARRCSRLVRSSWGVGSRVLANLRHARPLRREGVRPLPAAGGRRPGRGGLPGADVRRRRHRPARLVRQPTLVLHYADDPAVPLAGGRQVADGIADARLQVLEGAYHLPPARDAALVADTIVSWCREPPTSRSDDSDLKGPSGHPAGMTDTAFRTHPVRGPAQRHLLLAGRRNVRPTARPHKRRLFADLPGHRGRARIRGGRQPALPRAGIDPDRGGAQPRHARPAATRRRAPRRTARRARGHRPSAPDLPDASAEVVLSSLVLCSVADPAQVLAEVRRVLRPGGRFVFVEHVAAPDGTTLRRLQRAGPAARGRGASRAAPASATSPAPYGPRASTASTSRAYRLRSPFLPFNTQIAGVATA